MKGKTAPRLLQDFLRYDPSRPPASGYNILVDPPLQYEKGMNLPSLVAFDRCRHAWAMKYNQSRLPVQNRKPSPHMVYIVSAYCTECRSHLDLEMGFEGSKDHTLPCPNDDWPLHHFLHIPKLSYTRQLSKYVNDCQTFQCSSPRCSARLTIRIRPPRLTPEWVDLLSDPNTIRMRAERAVAENSERLEGHKIPSPSDVLNTLCQYIDNALKKEEVKTIQGNNKKFLLCLGEPCAEILQFLGFKRLVSIERQIQITTLTDVRL